MNIFLNCSSVYIISSEDDLRIDRYVSVFNWVYLSVPVQLSTNKKLSLLLLFVESDWSLLGTGKFFIRIKSTERTSLRR